MARAICRSCGEPKRQPLMRCGECGHDPSGDRRASAESLVLSIENYEDGTDRARYALELDQIGERMRTGERPQLDATDFARAMGVVDLGRQITWKHGLRGLTLVLLFLMPLLLIIGGAIALFVSRR